MVKTLAVLGLAAWPKLAEYHVDIPDFQRPAKPVLLEQNWSPAQRAAFHYPSDKNPDKLPVGFARHDDFHDPISKETYPVVGFTCAACHTGELFFGDSAIRIEGGSPMVDLGAFQKAVGLALGRTQKMPWRYVRFEKRVLGDGATDAQKAELKKNVDAFLTVGFKERDYAQEHNIYTNLSGFGRTDAYRKSGVRRGFGPV